jgi:hypothetical protein
LQIKQLHTLCSLSIILNFRTQWLFPEPACAEDSDLS